MKFLTALPFLLVAAPALAVTPINVGGLLSFLVYIAIVGLIFWVIWWALGAVGIPEPFNKVIRVVVIVAAVIFVVNLLLGLVGTPFFTLR